ncbi:MAG TPA: protein kinase, partial [Ktedonobacteraceae bacterium]
MADYVGQQLGNYQLISVLGQGGFAVVYLGEHIYLKTRAAIKVLHTRLDKNDLEVFLTESRTIATLVHPSIVRVLEFGVESDSNIPFLVLDYAPNGSLRQLHPRGTQVPLPTVTSYVKQVASALQYAHDQKLIHRDVKPENMLVGRFNDVLLSDFGIALIAQSSLSQKTQDVVGTVSYMAPEQITGKPRPASDQYSLGIVVYEWLSGSRPFQGSFTELCTQHIFATPPSLREKISTISPEVEQVVMTALAKEPKGRFGNVRAFANALEQASRSEQPVAPAPQHIVPSSSTPSMVQSAKASVPLVPQSDETSPPSPALEQAAVSSLSPTTQPPESLQPSVTDPSHPEAEPHSDYGHPAAVKPVATTPDIKGADVESRSWLAQARNLVGNDMRRALIAMVIGVMLYGGLNYYLDFLYKTSNPLAVTGVSILNNNIDGGIILADIILIIPLFLAAISGPLVGLLTIMAGLYFGGLFTGYDAATAYY